MANRMNGKIVYLAMKYSIDGKMYAGGMRLIVEKGNSIDKAVNSYIAGYKKVKDFEYKAFDRRWKATNESREMCNEIHGIQKK